MGPQLGNTVANAAKRADLSVRAIYREVKDGRLELRKVGKRSIITEESLLTWFANLPKTAA